MHSVVSLLLARQSDHSSGHPFLAYADQDAAAISITEKVIARANKSSVAVVRAALKR